MSPLKFGGKIHPDEIVKDKESGSKMMMNVHFSERSETEAQVTEEDESDGKNFGKEEINNIEKKK